MADDQAFVETCMDILDSEVQKTNGEGTGSIEVQDNVIGLINTYCT